MRRITIELPESDAARFVGISFLEMAETYGKVFAKLYDGDGNLLSAHQGEQDGGISCMTVGKYCVCGNK